MYGRKQRCFDDRDAVQERCLEHVDRRAEDRLAGRYPLNGLAPRGEAAHEVGADTTSRSGSPPPVRAACRVSRIRSVEP